MINKVCLPSYPFESAELGLNDGYLHPSYFEIAEHGALLHTPLFECADFAGDHDNHLHSFQSPLHFESAPCVHLHYAYLVYRGVCFRPNLPNWISGRDEIIMPGNLGMPLFSCWMCSLILCASQVYHT